jgi:hypothetical protein
MVNYQDGKIYKITAGCNLPYIGSTITTLSRRFAKHKTDKKFYLNHQKTNKCASFDLLEYHDCKIELLELFPCESKRMLEMRERYWFDILPNINIKKPFISKEETSIIHKLNYENNKEMILKKQKEYARLNIDTIHQKKNKSYDCACGLHYTHSNQWRHFRTIKHLNFLKNQK